MLFVHIFIGNLSYSTTDQTISVTRREVFVPTSSLSNSTGETLSYKSSSFSMPLQKHKTWSILSRGFKKKKGKRDEKRSHSCCVLMPQVVTGFWHSSLLPPSASKVPVLSSSSKIWLVTFLCLREISWLRHCGGLATALGAMVSKT